MADNQPVVSSRHAASQLGVGKATIIRWFQEGTLTGYKLDPSKPNSPLRINQESINALLRRRQQA